MPKTKRHRRKNGWYDEALLARAMRGPMTAKEVGSIVGIHSTDAVIWIRKRKDLSVTVVGETLGKNNNKVNLYQIVKLRTANEASINQAQN